jgi:hypothetical protein
MNPFGLSTPQSTNPSQQPTDTPDQARALSTPIRYCSLTLAHLPSHYLLPFTTLVETPPAGAGADASTLKVRLAPGRRSDYPSRQTLPQTSYIINRQDAIRHLSRKRHWTFLVLERQRAKVASLARRSAASQKLVQDLWSWGEGQVEGMGGWLERGVGVEVRRAVDSLRMGMMGVQDDDVSSPDEERVIGLKFFAAAVGSSEDVATNTPEEDNITTTYDLTTLLSPEALDSIKSYAAAQDVTADRVWRLKGPHALHIRLAIERLKSYKESNDIHKALPTVQNPVGSREARLQRLAERGARSCSEEEVEGKES